MFPKCSPGNFSFLSSHVQFFISLVHMPVMVRDTDYVTYSNIAKQLHTNSVEYLV